MNTCTHLRTNGSPDPLGIDDNSFRLTWRLPEDAAYSQIDRVQVRCAWAADQLESGNDLLWDSGEISPDSPNALPYEGPDLAPGTRVYWSVRVWAKDAEAPSPWAQPAFWETGLGHEEANWSGSKWIAHVVQSPRTPRLHCELFRRVFELPDKPIARARLYVATPGFFYAFCNGQPLNEMPCDPIPSQSDKRVYYRTFDVGDFLSAGTQVLGLRLASGFYSPAHPSVAHAFPVFRALLRVEFGDGPTLDLGTDDTWRATEDHIELTHFYNKGQGWGNEIWHLDREIAGWREADHDEERWDHATTVDAPSGILTGQPPVGHRLRGTLEPEKIEKLALNRVLVDFGQNITGRVRCRFTMRNARNTQVRLRHYDVWPRPNDFDQTDYWFAKSVAAQNAGVTVDWAPIYQLRNFRYVEVEFEGMEEDSLLFTAEAIGNLPPRTAEFECSEPSLNWIHETGLRTAEALTIFGVITDCAHREKDGWGAEGEANLNLIWDHYPVADFYQRFLQDCRDSQFDDGRIPYLIPYRRPKDSMCAGGPYYMGHPPQAAWHAYLYTGDERFLRENYEMGTRMIRFQTAQCEDGILKVFSFGVGEEKHGGEPRKPLFYLGDWLPPGGGAESFEDNQLFNTAYLIGITKRWQRIHETLQLQNNDADWMRERVTAWSRAFVDRFVDPETGVVGNGRQPAAVLTLTAGFLEPELDTKVYRQLKHRILQEDRAHFDTGPLATTRLLELLTQRGDVDLALTLLLQRDYPSLAHFRDQDLTVFPEEWDGFLEKYQTGHPAYPAGQGKSYCHTSFSGAVFWFLQALAGIRPDETAPGFRRVLLAPQFTLRLPWARGSMDAPQGRIESAWQWITPGRLQWQVTLPNGTEGRIVLPPGYQNVDCEDTLSPGRHAITLHYAPPSDPTPFP
jgi:alpha-L-rhamnosidase